MSAFDEWWARLPTEKREHVSFQQRAWNAALAAAEAAIPPQMNVEKPVTRPGMYLEGANDERVAMSRRLAALKEK